MNEKHQSSLKQYVNDVIALERDITNAVRGQLEDDRVTAHVELTAILNEVIRNSQNRIKQLSALSDQEGGSIGATVKEGIMAVTGVLAGVYGRIREHPLSRMVRDDVIALDVTSTSYGMLYTLGLSVGHSECAAIARQGLMESPPLVVHLTDLLPTIVAGELADEAPLANPAAAQIAQADIRESWKHHPDHADV